MLDFHLPASFQAEARTRAEAAVAERRRKRREERRKRHQQARLPLSEGQVKNSDFF